ncbi:MAG: hypothetical protein ACRDSP_08585 [Pseudonocardiaceae bacterium]
MSTHDDLPARNPKRNRVMQSSQLVFSERSCVILGQLLVHDGRRHHGVQGENREALTIVE